MPEMSDIQADYIADKIISAIGDPLRMTSDTWSAILDAIPFTPYRYTYPLGIGANFMRCDFVMNDRTYLELEFRAPDNRLLQVIRIHP